MDTRIVFPPSADQQLLFNQRGVEKADCNMTQGSAISIAEKVF